MAMNVKYYEANADGTSGAEVTDPSIFARANADKTLAGASLAVGLVVGGAAVFVADRFFGN